MRLPFYVHNFYHAGGEKFADFALFLCVKICDKLIMDVYEGKGEGNYASMFVSGGGGRDWCGWAVLVRVDSTAHRISADDDANQFFRCSFNWGSGIVTEFFKRNGLVPKNWRLRRFYYFFNFFFGHNEFASGR